MLAGFVDGLRVIGHRAVPIASAVIDMI